jgi:hypothetical protein
LLVVPDTIRRVLFLHFYLHISKICCNFAAENPHWRVCLFIKGGFSDILIAFIDALCLTKRNFATFELTVKIKVAVDAYGCDNYTIFVVPGKTVCHIGVGFLLFI